MKKILIDARMHDMSGIGTFTRHLIEEWIIDEDKEIALLGDKLVLEKLYPNIKIYNYDEKIYSISEQLRFPYKIAKEYDELFIPHYNIPLFYFGKMTSTIHDLIHLKFPEYFSKLAFLYAKFMIKMNLIKSNRLVTVSNFTKNDILKTFGYKYENKIEVRYNKVDKIFRKIDDKEALINGKIKFDIPIEKKIILFVGNKKPHKNLETLIRAFGELDNYKDMRLVLTGEGFKTYIKLEELVEKLNLNEFIIHTGKVSQEDLVLLYNIADLFVFPSFYEGFGIPPLEALACGTPTVCSNSASIPEVCGDRVEYFKPNDILLLKKLIEKYCVNQRELIR